MHMTLTPAQNGALKQLLMIVVLGVVAFLANAANLTPFMSAGIATIVSMLASSLESHIRATSGQGLFGAVNVR